jgi:type IV secretion system protein VirD4
MKGPTLAPTLPRPLSPYETGPRRETQWQQDGGIYCGYEIAPPEDEAHLLRGDWHLVERDGEYRRTKYASDRHVLTVGPNGSGKSRRLLLPSLYYLKNWSICAIDPKGELFAYTAAYRSKLPGHRVMLFDPFSVVKTSYPKLAAAHPELCESVGCNPVAALDPKSPRFVDDVKGLAVSLIKTESTKDQYWSMAAQALLKGLIMAQRIEEGAEASLGLVRQILGFKPEDMARELARMVDTLGGQYPAVKAALSEFISHNPQDRELGGIRRQAKTQTDWLDSAEMVADLKKGNGTLPLLKEQPTTIYLVLPPEFLASHGTWLRLMITTILRPMLRSVAAPTGNKQQVPVLFMLDEFAQLGHMEIIKDNYALMRGYGVKLWTIWQDLNQAKLLYGEWWESLVSNAGITQAFAPQDLTTRKYLSDLGGNRLTWHTRKSDSGGLSISRGGASFNTGGSSSDTQVTEPLLYPHELAQMGQGQSVLFTQRGHALRSYFPDVTQIPDLAAIVAEAESEMRG